MEGAVEGLRPLRGEACEKLEAPGRAWLDLGSAQLSW